MARCAICDKATSFGNNVSHSIRRTSRKWKPNIRSVRAIVDGTPKTINVCARCLRSNKVVRNVRGVAKRGEAAAGAAAAGEAAAGAAATGAGDA